MMRKSHAALLLASGIVLTCGDVSIAGEDLVARWQRADALCGLPSSVMTEQACQDRQRYTEALKRSGWCEAAPTTPYEHWGWQACTLRAAARPLRRHRPAPRRA
jgi:hypothetical protein